MINFKIVLIGDAGVGKTAIVHRFKYNTFVERHASTIGVDFTIKTMQVDDKKVKVCQFSVWSRSRLFIIFNLFYKATIFMCVSLLQAILSQTDFFFTEFQNDVFPSQFLKNHWFCVSHKISTCNTMPILAHHAIFWSLCWSITFYRFEFSLKWHHFFI